MYRVLCTVLGRFHMLIQIVVDRIAWQSRFLHNYADVTYTYIGCMQYVSLLVTEALTGFA